ncbi:MAG: patatin-like phospholipase family protein [Proteobacteria bacterium]|nr:patatin-like phospholipase family protein [Pseudomonadota bacterium]
MPHRVPCLHAGLLSALLAISAAASTAAHAATPATPPPARKDCIGLVLGGGGARGAAHIGVLEVLEREHIPICVISGTSMGAIVGSLYAVGYTPEEMRKIMDGINWKDLFNDDPPRAELPMRRKNEDFRYLLNFEIGFRDGRIVMPAGLVQGQKLLMLLRRLLLPAWHVEDFNHLQIPFHAVAANLGNGQPVILDHGNLPLAVRASMSVPGAFAPTRYDGQLLVDGGILDNVPVDVARKMGATRLIVVNVGTPLADEDSMTNPLAVMNQMLGVATLESTERQLRSLGPNDLLITPRLNGISAADFGDAASAIRIGEQAAEAALPELKRFSENPAQWTAWRAAHRVQAFDPGLVAFVHVLDANPDDQRVIGKHLAADVGKPLDVPEVEQQVSNLYGSGDYALLGWRPAEQDGQRGIEIIPEDKPWGPLYGKFGFQLSDDFSGRANYVVSAEVTATGLNHSNARWTNGVWLGRTTGLYSRFYQPFGDFDHGYLQPDFVLRNDSVPIFSDNKEIAEYRFHRTHLGVEAGWSPVPQWNVAVRLAGGYDFASLVIGDPHIFPDQGSNWTSVRVSTTWDTLDNVNFPTHGARVHLDYEAYRNFLGGESHGGVARLTGDWAINWGYGPFKRYTVLLGLRASSSQGNSRFEQSLEPVDFLGGFLNLSGHAENSLIGDQSALARAVAYRRMGGSLREVFGVPLYLGASVEAGNVWNDRSDVGFNDLIYAGSVFGGVNTPLGPLFLGFGHASDHANAWYLTFGSLLRPRQ